MARPGWIGTGVRGTSYCLVSGPEKTSPRFLIVFGCFLASLGTTSHRLLVFFGHLIVGSLGVLEYLMVIAWAPCVFAHMGLGTGRSLLLIVTGHLIVSPSKIFPKLSGISGNFLARSLGHLVFGCPLDKPEKTFSGLLDSLGCQVANSGKIFSCSLV